VRKRGEHGRRGVSMRGGTGTAASRRAEDVVEATMIVVACDVNIDDDLTNACTRCSDARRLPLRSRRTQQHHPGVIV
jgi:hypothetical protein